MTESEFIAKGTIKRAEAEYNKLHAFAIQCGYQIGQCRNLVTLFKKLDVTIEKLADFNEQKTSGVKVANYLIESFAADLKDLYALKKAIIDPLVIQDKNPKSQVQPKGEIK